MDYKYSYNCEVTSFEAGYDGYLRHSAILRLQQEAGERQVANYALDQLSLMEKGFAFVISSATVVINRLPKMREKLRIDTWSRGIKGARFYRAFNWYDESGELIIESCSVCAFVNFKEHTLVRDTDLCSNLPENFEDSNAAGTPRKLRVCVGEDCILEKVRFSRLDINGHLNNTFYADIVVDNLSTDDAKKVCKGFVIDFVNEAVLGDTIEIHTAKNADGVDFEGVVNGNTCFRARYYI